MEDTQWNGDRLYPVMCRDAAGLIRKTLFSELSFVSSKSIQDVGCLHLTEKMQPHAIFVQPSSNLINIGLCFPPADSSRTFVPRSVLQVRSPSGVPKLNSIGRRLTDLEAAILKILGGQTLDGLPIYYALRGTTNEVPLGMLSVTLQDMEKIGLINRSTPTTPNEKGGNDHSFFSTTPLGLIEFEEFNRTAFATVELSGLRLLINGQS